MTMNDWLTKDRSETDKNRLADKQLPDGTIVSNPALGIMLYNNAIPESVCTDAIEVLESNLNGKSHYRWQPAMVTEADDAVESARKCVDFKISSTNLGQKNDANSQLYEMHSNLFSKIKPLADDYGRYWGVGIGFYEAFNFVKYDGAGTHFKIHADHGPAYVATISIVAYLNEDYEGGEIYFPRFDLTIKPKAGDVVIFPSTYIYEHASNDMKSGTKYSVVIMTDYNDRGGLRYHPYREEDFTKVVY
jgi:prolyl 4-hydroxylase